MTIAISERTRPVATLQTLLFKMKADVLEFELDRLKTVAKGLVEAAPEDRKKWWLQLKILVGNGRPGDSRS